MYPRTYFDNFWRPELRDEVFVAMSFHPGLQKVWEQIIAPAIRQVNLSPLRVDATHISGSILTQIMDGIAHARLVLGELSGVMMVGPELSRNTPSANVTYELGLAHALRQESEVLLMAAEGSEIPFDVSSVRIHFYNPSRIDESREDLARRLRGALAEVDMIKHFKVEAAIRSMDRGCLRFLKCYANEDQFPRQTFAERVKQITEDAPVGQQAAMIEAERQDFVTREGAWYEWDKGHAVVHRLFDLGILAATDNPHGTGGFFTWTPFGLVVLRRMGLRSETKIRR